MPKYDAPFWRRVLGRAKPTVLMGTLNRLVENQEQKVTLALTDSLAEHELLESILEDSKPSPGDQPALRKLDYLLRTPWRYPPLHWGSRFGRRFEPSLFYGALSRHAVFAEAAYYRLVFLDGMEQPFKDRVISQFTVFQALYRTDAGLDLSQAPFARHEAVLRHKSDYTACQTLGSELRARDIEAITYLSARTEGREMNVALFSPDALRSRKHRNPRRGLCETRLDGVSFSLRGETTHFTREQFLYRGKLPVPA